MTANPDSDAALWTRTLAGDSEGFGALFDRHRERVFRHGLRLVETRQDAEDIVAATFLELWRRREDVRLVNGSVAPWLIVTATNMGCNLSRGSRRYRAFLSRLPREAAAADTADIALEISSLGIDGRLRAALRQLGETDLQLFGLVALEDYAVADAAALLGLTPSAAKSRLHRVRLRMRDLLAPQPPNEYATNIGGDR